MTPADRASLIKDLEDREHGIWSENPYTKVILNKIKLEHDRLVRQAEWMSLNAVVDKETVDGFVKQAAALTNILKYVTENTFPK